MLEKAFQENDIKIESNTEQTSRSSARHGDAYVAREQVADLVSAPLSEDVKITLQVSQNLHAAMIPYILGAVVAHNTSSAAQAGFGVERDVLAKAGLDLTAIAQSDGAGGDAFVTPDFMARYLAYMAKQTTFPAILGALPVLGESGTLHGIKVASAAVGQVHAKTGTVLLPAYLNGDLILAGKGIAGYTRSRDGEAVSFAIFVNDIPIRPGPAGNDSATAVEHLVDQITGQPLGTLAAAINQMPISDAR